MKVADAIGAQLDWMVAKCEGELDRCDFYLHESTGAFMLERGEVSVVYSPSTKWAQGGPIIERKGIELHVLPSGLNTRVHPTYKPGDLWEANVWPDDVDIIQIWGPTPLIAAMRCLICSKLGEEVEVPSELLT